MSEVVSSQRADMAPEGHGIEEPSERRTTISFMNPLIALIFCDHVDFPLESVFLISSNCIRRVWPPERRHQQPQIQGLYHGPRGPVLHSPSRYFLLVLFTSLMTTVWAWFDVLLQNRATAMGLYHPSGPHT